MISKKKSYDFQAISSKTLWSNKKFKIDLRLCVCLGSQWESSTGVGADATYARELLMQGQNAKAVSCSFCNLAVSLCVYL